MREEGEGERSERGEEKMSDGGQTQSQPNAAAMSEHITSGSQFILKGTEDTWFPPL